MWITALIMGLAGSVHCVGMCSPLAATVASAHAWRGALGLYHAGRITTYGILGAFLSGVGGFLDLPRFQFLFSWIAGVSVLLVAIGFTIPIRIPGVGARVVSGVGYLKSAFSKWLPRKSKSSIWILGMLNGLLPCGLTYAALLNTLGTGSMTTGFGLMVIFGLGTGPAMMGSGWLLKLMKNRWHISSRSWVTVSLFICGLLLLARVFFQTSYFFGVSSGHLPISICQPIIF